MNEGDIKSVAELTALPRYDAGDPEAASLVSGASAFEVAEAEDMIRLQDLLHRDEYQPLAVVRFPESTPETVRVYFRLLDEDE